MKILKQVLEVFLLIFFTFPLILLPYHISLKVGGFLGFFLYHVWRKRRNIAIDNVEKSMGSLMLNTCERIDTDDIIIKNFKNLGRSFVELVSLYYGFSKRVLDSVEVVGAKHYSRAKEMAGNRGVILITGHCGNWELLALAFSHKVDNVAVLARRLNNSFFNGVLETVRGRFGNRVVYKEGALRSVMRILRENGSVGILIDQAVIKEEGYIIDFLGRPAWASKFSALVARRTGACVVPAFISRKREGFGHVITVHPPVELSLIEDKEKAIWTDTQVFSSYVENYIKQHPDEWLWIHKRWKRT